MRTALAVICGGRPRSCVSHDTIRPEIRGGGTGAKTERPLGGAARD